MRDPTVKRSYFQACVFVNVEKAGVARANLRKSQGVGCNNTTRWLLNAPYGFMRRIEL
jgi:hypothetical protein